MRPSGKLTFKTAVAAVFVFSTLISASAQSKGFSLLYTFTGSPDGSAPNYLIQTADGTFYGTTFSGGAYGYGTVFEIDSTGTETIVYSFQGTTDGSGPQGVVLDSLGNIWGTTQSGGADGYGTLFKIAGDGFAVRHSFAGYPLDGEDPIGPPVMDAAGNLYGITQGGGNGSCEIGPFEGCGMVFAFNTFSGYEGVVHNFTGWPTDGASPAALVINSKGDLYGTTALGGTTDCTNDTPGCGIVYKLSSTGKESILHSFTGSPDGDNPTGLVLDPQGNIYGSTVEGGGGLGNIYELPVSGKIIQLYSFTGGSSGENPEGSLARDKAGNLYGSTLNGGPSKGCAGSGCGTIFKVSSSGKETVLFVFPPDDVDGTSPTSGVFLGMSGELYGVAPFGGTGYGVAFEQKP